METAALPIRRCRLLLPLLLLVSTVAAFEIGEQLMDYVRKEFGSEAYSRLDNWQNLHRLAARAPVERQLRLVNTFFNRVRFVNDIEHWGQEDYWATPVELLTTNGGDCEDFSIAKYLTLKSMGVPDEQLRIVYVKALELNQAHMVLAWYPEPDADPLILDNLINEIKPASQRPDLEPVYSFNGGGLWLNRSGGQQQRIGEAEKLEHWQDVNRRLINALR
ncbi:MULTISPECIES: transglutaminase-like cysteine peptidase [Marinobacter]|uniref:transglutaminase-like cysteine peptidase n=1 Tax=Marinobacter TaxID=2742 RepID=UPI002006988F|nr:MULTISPECIES: transglutaminase-like cysteine peptidase [Marinobacter]MCK7550226.1 transglutaminase-like cysteine peptidase [Marinobacter goseongensis]MDV3503764.1 transglutaminase-like cysteine peptidase [Marinobacter sp. M-5]